MDPVTTQAVKHVQGILEMLNLANKRLLLAISGGADSMALAYLVRHAVGPTSCHAVTVDHGFRPQSAFEAHAVGQYMKTLGIRHEIRKLTWKANSANTDQKTAIPLPSLQRMEEVFRQRRYAEINSVCRNHGIGAVLTGHHAGDQAETFLFRFMRQSGIYGLSGMPLQSAWPLVDHTESLEGRSGPVVVRPLLQIGKPTLYHICKTHRIEWHEDGSNQDVRFRRNLLRKAISDADNHTTSPFHAKSLLNVCMAMQRHRDFINHSIAALLTKHAAVHASLGAIEVSAQADKGQLPPWMANAALCERMLARIVSWVNCKDHPPELAHLQQFSRTICRYYTEDSEHASTSAANVTLLAPAGSRGWVLCRQRPRRLEIPLQTEIPLNAAVLWDKRLMVGVRKRSGCHVPDGTTWEIVSLPDAMQQWADCLAQHRHALRKIHRQHIERHHTVQASQPVILVKLATSENPKLVYALGKPVAGSLADTCLDITVSALKNCPTENQEIVFSHTSNVPF
ncbi:hypothetical protein LPJ78_000513 [Coemansia sp. RSA 989]|nr:hypothetical protein LPJ78_000513 [Coemansia sp. RSA 989]KAJ1875368.1 hypothetical protein LPJ55_000724 [Coemansia sp. RSA 990]